MEGLNVYAIGYEECRADKEEIELISSYNMLHFVLSGKGYFNGRTVTAGQAFVCRVNRHTHYFPDRTDPWTYYWIDAGGVMSNAILYECGFHEDDVVNYTVSEKMQHLFDLGTESINPDYLSGIFIAAMALMKSEKSIGENSLRERHVRECEKLIFEKNGRITPNEAADILNLSRAYLRNLFVGMRGQSLMDYIINYRITKAQELLDQTDYTIALIASSVGYDDQFQFAKIFKKRMGKSPSQFRKYMRQLKNELDATVDERKK